MLELTVRVEAPVPPDERSKPLVDKLAESPNGDERVRVTVPEKLFRLARLIWDVPLVPTEIVTDDAAAPMVKSETLTVMVME